MVQNYSQFTMGLEKIKYAGVYASQEFEDEAKDAPAKSGISEAKLESPSTQSPKTQ